jgi:hypothetical protein
MMFQTAAVDLSLVMRGEDHHCGAGALKRNAWTAPYLAAITFKVNFEVFQLHLSGTASFLFAR